jgi:hypothetical protein
MSKKADKPKKSDKKKKSVGGSSGPNFFLQHAEKLVFGLFGGVILLCIFGAMGHEAYTNRPEELGSMVQQKQTTVANNHPATFTELAKAQVKESPKTNGSTGPAVSESLAPMTEDPVFRPKLKRGEVEQYLPPVDLRGWAQLTSAPFVPEGGEKGLDDGQNVPFGGGGLVPDGGAPGPAGGAKKGPRGGGTGMTPGPPGYSGGGKKGKKPRGGEVGGLDLGGGGEASPAASGGMGSPEDQGQQEPRPGVVPPSGSIPKGFHTAILTARVPREEQAKLYQKAFEMARGYNPGADVPQYVSFLIQRADVTDGDVDLDDPNDPKWIYPILVAKDPKGDRKVHLIEYSLLMAAKWAVPYPYELVDNSRGQHVVPLYLWVTRGKDKREADRYEWRGFTFPLIPLLGENWGERITGGFPVLKPGSEYSGGTYDGGNEYPGGFQFPGSSGGAPGPAGLHGGEASPPAPSGFSGGSSIRGQRGSGQGGYPGSGYPGSGSGGYPSSGMGGHPGPGMGYPGSGSGGFPSSGMGGHPGPGMGYPGSGGIVPDGGGMLPGGGMGGGDGGMGQGQANPMADILLRFFDFSVEEGHRYRYRVAVYLYNPNYNKLPSLLKDERLANDEYRYSTWSAPSDIVSVSTGSDALAGPAKRGSGDAVDSMTVIMRQRDRILGATVTHAFSNMQAGQLLDLRGQKDVRYEHPVSGVAKSAKTKEKDKEKDHFDFKSGDLIVDLKPGKEEMLVIDSNGALTLRSARNADSTNNYRAEWKRLERLHYQPNEESGAGSNQGFGDFMGPSPPAGGKSPRGP